MHWLKSSIALALAVLLVACGGSTRGPDAGVVTSGEPDPGTGTIVTAPSFEALLAEATGAEAALTGHPFQEIVPGTAVWRDGAVYDAAVVDFIGKARRAVEAFQSSSIANPMQYAERIAALSDKVQLARETVIPANADAAALAAANAMHLLSRRKELRLEVRGLCNGSDTSMLDCYRNVLRMKTDGDTALLRLFAQRTHDLFVIATEEHRQWGRQRAFDVWYNQTQVRLALMEYVQPGKLASEAVGAGYTYEVPGS